MQTKTSDQQRHDIDQGLTGEKVAMPDPAAAPLGTDAEAGGSSPTAGERRVADQTAPALPDATATRPGWLVYALALLAVAALAVLIVSMAR